MPILEFVYTTVFRSPRIRAIINKIILLVIPTSVRVGNATVMINPQDPVVSGALTFGVYEKTEISLMQKICKPNQVVVDIGANVGLYTAIAGLKVGDHGHVIAFEPDPESFHYLQQTVRINKLTNTHTVHAALSHENGKAKLFTSSSNRGDHRMYPSAHADGNVEIETFKLDDYLKNKGLTAVDIVKIDVQGFEGHVITGFENTIRCSPKLIMLMEFWPAGLTSAGTDPLELLQRLENFGLDFYEIKHHDCFKRVEDKMDLIKRLPGRKYTNLVFLGPQAEWTT